MSSHERDLRHMKARAGYCGSEAALHPLAVSLLLDL